MAVRETDGVNSRKGRKTEPVRISSTITVVSAAVMILLDKFGVANFSAVEVSMILAAIAALANEAARMKVFAPVRDKYGGE
jgi:hypothetical protein